MYYNTDKDMYTNKAKLNDKMISGLKVSNTIFSQWMEKDNKVVVRLAKHNGCLCFLVSGSKEELIDFNEGISLSNKKNPSTCVAGIYKGEIIRIAKHKSAKFMSDEISVPQHCRIDPRD